MTRPHVVVGVVGTATEVGKTWVTAHVIEALRAAGRSVAARKPAQSFADGDAQPTDADVLALASGEAPHVVCPPHRWYPLPMAPPMAAEALGLPAPTLAELLDELHWPEDPAVDLGFVEAVGGVRSPVAGDADSRDLVRGAGVDIVVLVADAGLGAIDAVRLAVDALAPMPVVVVLNRFDPTEDVHLRNRAWLSDRDGYEIVTDVADLASRLS